ncbi:MAG: ABC transporter substrate-binding protein [Syntrophotaleaceae bacterium]
MKCKKLIIFSILMFLIYPTVILAAPPGPTEQLRTSVDKIVEILRDKSLSQDAILSQVADLVRDKFDFRAMSQRTLGVHWKDATAKQQDRFVDLFSQLLEDTYRGRIRSYTYGDEYVKYIGERVRDGRAEVDTIIVANREIPVSYRMRLKDGKWLVYDVIIEEVSLISNYRNSYAQIIRSEGFDTLLSRMEDKIKELQATNQTQGAGLAMDKGIRS